MSHTVYCKKLNKTAPALEHAPWPGELGQRIVAEISKEAWDLWQSHQVLLINEYQLNTSDPKAIDFLEQNMRGFLFSEGEYGDNKPQGFNPGS